MPVRWSGRRRKGGPLLACMSVLRPGEVCYIAHTSLKRLPAPLSDREALAVRFSARAGYFSDLLEAGTPEDQAKIFQEREEVDAWTARILNGS